MKDASLDSFVRKKFRDVFFQVMPGDIYQTAWWTLDLVNKLFKLFGYGGAVVLHVLLCITSCHPMTPNIPVHKVIELSF